VNKQISILVGKKKKKIIMTILKDLEHVKQKDKSIMEERENDDWGSNKQVALNNVEVRCCLNLILSFRPFYAVVSSSSSTPLTTTAQRAFGAAVLEDSPL